MLKFILILFFAIGTWTSSSAKAWGKRGHALVNVTAARLIIESENAQYLRDHIFDLGYYANVPDIIWKNLPDTYDVEENQHYVDLEIFDRIIKSDSEWPALRDDLEKRFPQIPRKAGRSFWRVQELADLLSSIAERLREKKYSDKDAQHKLQLEWLSVAGISGHYWGDMGQPMHCSENYDGQKGQQRGIHHFFEETVVDELGPQLEAQLIKSALSQWPKFKESHKTKTAFVLAQELCRDSIRYLDKVMAMDKKLGRGNLKKAAGAYQELIQQRLVTSSLYLALIWSRNMGWDFNSEKFFSFSGAPEYICPKEKFGRCK